MCSFLQLLPSAILLSVILAGCGPRPSYTSPVPSHMATDSYPQQRKTWRVEC